MQPKDITLLIERYAAHTDRSPHTAGRLASGSGDLYRRLSSGADITSGRARRILQWFSDHWPDDELWPLARRPAPTPDSPAARAALARSAEADEALSAALELGADGRLRSDVALRRALGITAGTWKWALLHADGGPRERRQPRGDSRLAVEALMASGDRRFRRRRQEREIELELARQMGITSPERRLFERVRSIRERLDAPLEQANRAAAELAEEVA